MSQYEFPKIDLLDDIDYSVDNNLDEYIQKIEKILKDFKIHGEVVYSFAGPISLQFEVQLKPGTKVEKILDLEREFQLYLGSTELVLEGPRDNKSTIGIKIPNDKKYDVHIKTILKDEKKNLSKMNIPVILGKKDSGENIIFDLTEKQHLLIGGITGSGKTTFLNSLITTILFNKSPDEVKFAMFDTKGIDFAMYNGIPHLLCPIVTNAKMGITLLNKLVDEMKKRYELFGSAGVKKIDGFNNYVENHNNNNQDKKNPLPYIVAVIDWLDEMMLVENGETSSKLFNLIRNGDEAGIHIVISTQRPDYTVLPGLIRDNINSIICFQVRSVEDSKIVLGEKGAESIKNIGECIFKPLYGERIIAKVATITDDEQKRLVESITDKNKSICSDELIKYEDSNKYENPHNVDNDALYNEIVDYVKGLKSVSASLIQRNFKLGYNRAATIIDQLEKDGLIGSSNNTGKRSVLVNKKYCTKCGNKIVGPAKYCIVCGEKVF